MCCVDTSPAILFSCSGDTHLRHGIYRTTSSDPFRPHILADEIQCPPRPGTTWRGVMGDGPACCLSGGTGGPDQDSSLIVNRTLPNTLSRGRICTGAVSSEGILGPFGHVSSHLPSRVVKTQTPWPHSRSPSTQGTQWLRQPRALPRWI